MNLHEEDLNLLVIFEALMETRSVSKASERLNLSQPSMSNREGE
jgi:DNA-binding transcriptional LysR family regulator